MQADHPSPRLVIPLPGASTPATPRHHIPPELRALGADLARAMVSRALPIAARIRPGLLLSVALMLATFLACSVAAAAGYALPTAAYVLRSGLWTLLASSTAAVGLAGLRACASDWGWTMPTRAAPPPVRTNDGWQTVFEDT